MANSLQTIKKSIQHRMVEEKMNCPKCGQELRVVQDMVTCFTNGCIGDRTVKSLAAEKKYLPEVEAAARRRQSEMVGTNDLAD